MSPIFASTTIGTRQSQLLQRHQNQITSSNSNVIVVAGQSSLNAVSAVQPTSSVAI